jgi:F-type H+-transporting ATPase subunit delta
VKGSTAVAKSYAKALFDLATERGQAEAVGREIDAITHLLRDHHDLAAALSRPWLSTHVKRATAIEVANRAGISPLARDFFALVVTRGRVAALEGIVEAYRELADAAAGRLRARVRTAVPLTDDERRTLAARLGRELGGRQVMLEEVVDPALLGGFVAEVGSRVLDASLDGQLARLRQRFTTA